jgi:uncharacterized membrane-anchored protein YitT (DUF2179 family)
MMTAKKLPVRRSVWREIRSYAIITVGLLVYAFAWTNIIASANIMGGGGAGIAMLVYYITGGAGGGIPVGVSYLILNAVLVTIAGFILGPKFGLKTIYAILVISGLMTILQLYLPANLLGLADDKLLSAILGGGLAGAGISLCFMQGGSSGGMDIIAMIVNKYRNISYGRILMICDIVILGLSVLIFRNITALIYGYVVVGVFGVTLDSLIAGNRQSSQILIMSKKYEEIADHIVTDVHRGVTVLEATGWYTKKEQKVLMVACRKSETTQIYRIIKEIDPQAFITVGSVMGVYGEGFENLRTK